MNSDKQQELIELVINANKNINETVRPGDTVLEGKKQLEKAAELAEEIKQEDKK